VELRNNEVPRMATRDTRPGHRHKPVPDERVSVEVSLEAGHALIRCNRCGAELVLWTRKDLAVEGLATLFTAEHLECTPKRRSDDV
jgi:hypothetical protein